MHGPRNRMILNVANVPRPCVAWLRAPQIVEALGPCPLIARVQSYSGVPDQTGLRPRNAKGSPRAAVGIDVGITRLRRDCTVVLTSTAREGLVPVMYRSIKVFVHQGTWQGIRLGGP